MKLRTPLEFVEAIKLVRPYADGFTATDGYDIRSLNRIKLKPKARPRRRVDKVTGEVFETKEYTPREINAVLSYAKRKKLQRYFDVINFNMAEPHIVKRPRNKKRLRSLQEFSQHEDYPKDLKVAFLPAAHGAKKTKLVWKGDVLKKIIQNGITRYTINFDKKRFVQDPEKEIDAALNQTSSKYFMVQAGKHVIYKSGGPANLVKKEILNLQGRYGADKFDPNDPNSHHFGNWLNGIIGFDISEDYDIDAQMEMRDFIVEYRKERYSELEFREKMRQLLRTQENAIKTSNNTFATRPVRANAKKRAKSLSRERVKMQINFARAKKGLPPRVW